MDNVDSGYDFTLLEGTITYSFSRKQLLVEALTHKSYSHEHRLKRNYERLEFLGDAVLQLIVTEYLLLKYRDYDEGILSKLRGYFVSEAFLSNIAREIDLGSFILLGKGEIATGGKEKDSLLCDIFESVIAAIYLDSGYEDARRVVIERLGPGIDDSIADNSFVDSKTELQKYTQKHYGKLPVYSIVSEDGPEHEKLFVVAVQVGDLMSAEGEGRTKKAAEKEAAKRALARINALKQ